MKSFQHRRIPLFAAVLVICAAAGAALAVAASSGHRPEQVARAAAIATPKPTIQPSPVAPTAAGIPRGSPLTAVPGQRTSGSGWHWDGNAVVVDADRASITDLDIAGPVVNDHTYLTIKRTRIRCVNENDWCLNLGPHGTITESDIGGGTDGNTYLHAVLIYTFGPGSLIARCNLHHSVEAIRLDNGTTVRDSWIHDMVMGDPVRDLTTGQVHTDYHSGGIMVTGAGPSQLTPIVIDHNRIEGGNTANLFVQRDVTDDSKRVGDLLIEHNTFIDIRRNRQDSSFGIDVERKGIAGTVTIVDNRFTRSTWTVGPIQAPAGTIAVANAYLDGVPVRIYTS